MKQLLGVTRPNFLTLSVVCIALAATVALEHRGQLVVLDLLLVTLLALSAHVSVNAFNEYFDYKSGLDLTTQRTPFSGGSGTLVSAPYLVGAALRLAGTTLLITILLGLWLVWTHSIQLLWLGVLGVLLIYSYTEYLNRLPWVCLVAPGIGFGLCITLGASWVLAGTLTATSWLVGIVMTLLVSNLLLLNQFPDIAADRANGRRHLPIVWGELRSGRLFALLYALAYSAIGLAVLFGGVTPWVLLSVLSLGLCVPLVQGVLRAPHRVTQNPHLLTLNVAVIHIVPLLMAAGLLLSWWLRS